MAVCMQAAPGSVSSAPSRPSRRVWREGDGPAVCEDCPGCPLCRGVNRAANTVLPLPRPGEWLLVCVRAWDRLCVGVRVLLLRMSAAVSNRVVVCVNGLRVPACGLCSFGCVVVLTCDCVRRARRTRTDSSHYVSSQRLLATGTIRSVAGVYSAQYDNIRSGYVSAGGRPEASEPSAPPDNHTLTQTKPREGKCAEFTGIGCSN